MGPLNQFFKARIMAFLVFLAAFAPLTAQLQDPYVVLNFTKQLYGAESQNWSITSDQNGFIYGANNVGLIEFNGVNWNFYPSPNGTVIRSVAVDRHNRIYTSGYREIGFWERDPMGKLSYQSLTPKAEPLFSLNEEFWNTVIIGDKIYFHSFSSVFLYENEEFKKFRPDDALINSISNVGGKLCMHLSGKGLYTLEDTIIKPFVIYPELTRDVIHFVLERPDSSLVIGTASNGLYLYKENRLSPFLEEWRDYFSENKINRGTITFNGNMVIGTLLDGIVMFNPEGKLLHRINNDHGLQNNTVLGMYCDSQSNLWISMDQGVDCISFLVDPSYTFYINEEIGAVYSAALFRGDLYLCTNQGVFYREWEDVGIPFMIVPGTQGQAWSCNVFDDQLIVNHNGGTFRIENHEPEWISIVSGGISAIRDPLKEDVLVQSTYSNIVFYNKVEGNWRYAYQLPGFNDLIRYLELDYNNNLWAGHMHRGIYRLKLNDDQDSILRISYLGDSVFGKDFDIQVFNIENRIVFTTGREIYTYNDLNDSIVLHGQMNRALGKFAGSHRIIPGEDHHYWFISDEGIGLFRILDSEVTLVKEYPIDLFKDHLISGYENILPLSATEGLLCMDNGYAILRAGRPDLSHLIEDKELLLESVTVSGRTGKRRDLPVDQKTIRVPYHTNDLILGFAFPMYSSEKVAFQYYIEGLDNQWSEPLDKPVFNFARIPSGVYTIRVSAYNGWGNRSKEEDIILYVEPPWYLSTLSIIIYALILFSGLLLGRIWLIRRIRVREHKIKESKEKELIRLKNEKLDAELSFKSKELANLTMAIIKKNEFLLELKETIKQQKEDLGTRFPEKYYSNLIKKIDSNISSMDDWKVFQFHFEKAHEKFLQKLMAKYPQLSNSDLRLCAYLRMNLSSKEIAPLLRISYRGVENHRYRLRKKLNLNKDVNLTDFILSF